MREMIIEEPLFVCAGEPSGDKYAALLIRQLKMRKPELKVSGIGGSSLREAGVALVDDYSRLTTFGFSEGVCGFYRNLKMYVKIARRIHEARPRTFIAVAYPGINLLLCRYAKRLGCTIYYFLPPQIWAWGAFRKYFVKKWVDKVVSIFPFEYRFYRKLGIVTDYFENPLREELRQYRRDNFMARIGFMPGSRKSQIKRNLPIMIEMMNNVSTKHPNVGFSLILHSKEMLMSNRWISAALESLGSSIPNKIVTTTGKQYQAMKNCDLLIISSGTASLEAVFMNIPQIFFNRPSLFDYYVFRHFLKIDEYNLANLYLNKKVITSIISFNSVYILKKIREIDLSKYF